MPFVQKLINNKRKRNGTMAQKAVPCPGTYFSCPDFRPKANSQVNPPPPLVVLFCTNILL